MNSSLVSNIGAPQSRYLVFTSAGDNSNLPGWLKGRRNFDIWINYYGNEKDRYKDLSDFYVAKKGGKFPNLHYTYRHWENILKHYDAIFVMDDDIIINGTSISRLFEIHNQYDLWLLQPAFDPKGKINHAITQVQPLTSIRYTNFVEVTCPLFRRDKLDEFMKIYDPALVGWGVDWWFLDILPADRKDKVAIVDQISCINPKDEAKGGIREIDTLQSRVERIKTWERIRKQHNIQSKSRGYMEFGAV